MCSSSPRPCRSASRRGSGSTTTRSRSSHARTCPATRGSRCGCRRCSPRTKAGRCGSRRSRTPASCSGSSSARAAPATRRSPTNRIGCSPSSPVRSRSRSTTRGSTPRCRPRSTICASPTTSCACRAPASSPRPTSPAARSSATSTTARSSTSSRSAVKLGLARQLLEADPSTLGPMLEELRGDAQETLTQLRELAHGIYPPLLMDRGLGEALRAGREPRRARHRRARGCRPLPARRGGGGLLLLPRSAAERGQARGRGRAHHDHGRGVRRASCASRWPTTAPGSTGRATRCAATASSTWPTGSARSAVSLTVDSAPGSGTQVRGRLPLEPVAADRGRRSGLKLAAISCASCPTARARARDRSPPCGRTRSRRSPERRPGGRLRSTSRGGSPACPGARHGCGAWLRCR